MEVENQVSFISPMLQNTQFGNVDDETTITFSGHILQCLRGDVLDTKQGILCLWRVRILPAIVHAALAGDAAQRRIVPQDGELAFFRRLCFKARTMERNANFFEVTELLSCVAAVHVVNLLFSVN